MSLDMQLKRGLLEICVLACLNKGESYGYQVIKDLENIVEISESTLYPVLKRLESNGMVKTHEEIHNGRTRKYFEITKSGLWRLREFKNEQVILARIYDYIKESF